MPKCTHSDQREVYDGGIETIDNVMPTLAKSPSASMAARSLTDSVNSNVSAALCGDHSQEPRLRISRSTHPGAHSTLRYAAAESALYRRHSRQTVGCAGWTDEGDRNRHA